MLDGVAVAVIVLTDEGALLSSTTVVEGVLVVWMEAVAMAAVPLSPSELGVTLTLMVSPARRRWPYGD